MTLLSHAEKKTPVRIYRAGLVADIQGIADELTDASPHFVLFLAMDATNVSDSSVRRAARQLIDRGLVYLCAWGPDCERVHDCFDKERADDEPDDAVVMTTWHNRDSLKRALWYFRDCAWPTGAFESTCTDWIAISVGDVTWDDKIREELYRVE